MSADLSLTGVAELRAALAQLPEQVSREEFEPLVRATAEGLAGELRSTYARKTGDLASKVIVEASPISPITMKVRSKAPHAHLYEYGTVRRFTSRTGAARGSMPAQPTFIPAAVRWRERMIRQARAALSRMRVPGFSGSLEVRES